jgi:cell pole-organizing protein PopZ
MTIVRQAGEPSVEEILESIKKVIARDNRAEAEHVRRRREENGIVTTRSFSGGDLPQEPATTHPSEEPAPVLELTDAEVALEDQAIESHDDYPEDPADAPDVSDRIEIDEPLLAETSRASMRESLSALAMLAEPGARPQIVRSGETSLEALTRDLLRPMLAEWLDKNLPPMVDKLVAAEIARIAGKRG